MIRPAWVEIDLEDIRKNILEIKSRLETKTLFMAVVKANGYGHGAAEVAKAALISGADRLGVALIEEGIVLRKAGIKAPIHLLTGVPNGQSKKITELNLIPSVFTKTQVDELASLNEPISVHVKVDTGMNRLGIKANQAIEFIQYIKQLANLKVEGLFSHFSCADDPKSPHTNQQLKIFNELIAGLEKVGINIKIKHFSNSAATILRTDTHFDMARVGIAMYGLHPSDATKSKINLEPALSLKSKISFAKKARKNESVSYGATFVAARDTNIGVIPIGYADGYSRRLSNKSHVITNGNKLPQIGTICMDQLMVDLGFVEAKIGDEVILIGKQGALEVGADELASILRTINYEIVCAISPRVPRVYLNE